MNARRSAYRASLPRPSVGGLRPFVEQAARGTQKFQPLPAPTGKSPFHLDLANLLPPEEIQAIQRAKRPVFHAVGDTGGVKDPVPQRIAATQMETQLAAPRCRRRSGVPPPPRRRGVLLWGSLGVLSPVLRPVRPLPGTHPGDPRGNHDGDVADPTVHSLDTFVRNLCAAQSGTSPDAGESTRQTMTQPNEYWTLGAVHDEAVDPIVCQRPR